MSDSTILFLSYGGKPMHVAETQYAILSAHRALQPGDGIGILLYTDHPELFEHLPVEIRPITEGELSAWAGPEGYLHRRKPVVMRDALDRQGHKIAFVDSDTWFRKPASALFDRIGPGRSVLHINEGGLTSYEFPPNRAMSEHLASTDLFDLSGRKLDIGANEVMWNSGVTGIDPADGHLLDEAVHLIDQVWPKFKGSMNVEQLAVTYPLRHGTTISAASDVVFHYWPIRKPFHERLPRIMSESEHMAAAERAEWLHKFRPRLAPAEQAKYLVKQAYRATGRTWPRGAPSNAS